MQPAPPNQQQVHTMIFYYVPEDKDELATPNAFMIRRPMAEITLELIEKEFPMDGAFFYRFKYNHTGQTVWLDLSNRKCPVPKYNNQIIIKVTRKVAKNTLQEDTSATAASSHSYAH